MSFLGTLSILAGIGYGALQVLGRTSGASRVERTMALPGDEIVARPNLQTTHAVTIGAGGDEVWPWLVQMGWHQGGWYTSPWVDRVLFPANDPAVDYIIPELQHRKVGDFIPDGPPESECGFVIEHLDSNRALVLHSTSHLPLSWRRKYGASLDWTWSFNLFEDGGGTRMVFRARGKAAPGWVWAGYHAFLVPADFVMAGQMMRGIKRRAETGARRDDVPLLDLVGGAK